VALLLAAATIAASAPITIGVLPGVAATIPTRMLPAVISTAIPTMLLLAVVIAALGGWRWQ
jgi:ABC-type antimicrobial peptide transport system permease subunit